MPTLKQIECRIAVPPFQKLLDEIRPVYTDGCVETFVAIPDEPSAFNIHVTSEGFIAPGLAVFVFIDGVYQCMRFRADLTEAHPPYTRRQDTEVDFLFRQKEEKIQGDRFLGREWRFDKLKIAATDANANRSDEIGTIEVVVLRLHGMEAPKEIMAMHPHYDGANDDSDRDSEEDTFGAGFDGPSDRRESDRYPRVPLSFIAPGSLTGTSSASPVVPVGGMSHFGSYYDMYRPRAGPNYPVPGMAEPAPRRRFRPSSDHEPGVVWRPEMDRVFTVAVSSVKESDSQLSEANRRPAQAIERAHSVSGLASKRAALSKSPHSRCQSGNRSGRARHVNFQDGFPQNPFAYGAEPWAMDRSQPHAREDSRPLWRRDQPDSELASTVTFRGYERPSFHDQKHRYNPRYANETQASHNTKDKGDAQNSTEKPAAEEQPATFENANVEQAGAWANEQKNNDNEGFDQNWQPDHGSKKDGEGEGEDKNCQPDHDSKKDDEGEGEDKNCQSDHGSNKDNEGEGEDKNCQPDHGSNKDNEGEKVVQNSQPDQGSKKAKSHKSSKAPSSVSYMHVPSVPEEPIIKSYWKHWNKRPVEQKYKLAQYVENSRGFVTAPSELPEQVPEREAKKRGLKHQVYAGQGSEYRHRLGVPVYKDSMEHPYAVFRFRYRTKETLRKMLRDRDADWEKAKKREEQQKLMSMSKEELVEQLMKKSSISGKSSSVKQAVRDASGSAKSVRVSDWVQTVAKVSSSQKSEAKSKMSLGKITCDPCGKELADTDKWWHCEDCDFDMCLPCTNGKNWCNVSSHELEKWGGSTVEGKREILRQKTSSKHGGSQSGKAPSNKGGSQNGKPGSQNGGSQGAKSRSNKGGSQNGKPGSQNSGSKGGKSRAGSQKEADQPAEANQAWVAASGFDNAATAGFDAVNTDQRGQW